MFPYIFLPCFNIKTGKIRVCYDTRFAVIYGEGLSFTQENLEQLQMETDSYGCNCLVINSEYDNIEFFNSIGFSKIYNTEHYEVYAK